MPEDTLKSEGNLRQLKNSKNIFDNTLKSEKSIYEHGED